MLAVGRFGKPYGIRGWMKVISYTDPIDNILQYLPWRVFIDQRELVIDQIESKLQQNNLLIKLPFCNTPEEAKTYTNLEISIEREQLPQITEQDEYYWTDLIGLTVINQQQENLGTIKKIFETGSNDVLVVVDQIGKERYLPYTKSVILEVDQTKQTMWVDWDSSF